jgi:hypothetical protein
MTQRYVLYFLQDPRRGKEKKGYVGYTYRFHDRYLEHCSEIKRTKKSNWIQKLKKEFNLKPIPIVLCVCSKQSAPFLEIEAIKRIRSLGYELTNTTDGGEGSRKPLSEEHKAKIILANKLRKGRKNPKLAAFMKGKPGRHCNPHTLETRKKIAEKLRSQRGTWTEERRSHMKRLFSSNSKAKISLSAKLAWSRRKETYAGV